MHWKRVGIILLTSVFFLGVVVGVIRQISGQKNTPAQTTLAEAQRLYEEGVSLLPLNTIKSRERLSRAKLLVDPLVVGIDKRTEEGKRIQELYQTIDSTLTLAKKIIRTTPELFYDASFLKSGAKITSMGFSRDVLAFTDERTQTVFAVSAETKQGSLIAGGKDFLGVSLIDKAGEHVYSLIDQGIRQIDEVVVQHDNEWGEIASLLVYSGNIYLLDTGKNRIWKYIGTDEGFSARQQYLVADEFPDFSDATGMAIDGVVWIGTKHGAIMKFVQGRQETFVPQGVEPVLGQYLIVYTGDDVAYLYILDNQNSRIVVLDKEGMYLAQYVWDNGLAPVQLAVSERLKKIFLLADGKIFSINL